MKNEARRLHQYDRRQSYLYYCQNILIMQYAALLALEVRSSNALEKQPGGEIKAYYSQVLTTFIYF